MEITYRSTRGGIAGVSASDAILQGIAPDGGLYVPDKFPCFDRLRDLASWDYQTTAYEILRLFLTDYTDTELRNCVSAAYDSKFDTDEIIALEKHGGAYYLELFHGQTIAFKDMALSILPHLMTAAARKNRKSGETVILTATSGDTGKAALAGFADVPGIRIAVFYPKNGVSPMQERQMVTQQGSNTCVIGILGTFDDAQTGVKRLFADETLCRELESEGFRFSSANSINIGRLVPQIAYYFAAYGKLVARGVIECGQQINVTVPTGNFGNILAAYYARRMGLPISKLLCASNENNVLTDFIHSGTYDRNRPFHVTTSPSMDILVSSNLERLLYAVSAGDCEIVRKLMSALDTAGRYDITDSMKEGLADFYAGYASQGMTAARIKAIYDDDGYVIDPHTAVASAVYAQYLKETGDTTPTVIVSTASPYKFPGSVLEALGEPTDGDGFEQARRLSALSHVDVPAAITSLKDAPIIHTGVCKPTEMKQAVRDFLR